MAYNDNIKRYDSQVVDGTLKPLGYAQDTTISAASPLPSIPTGARIALITVTGAAARWTDDGSTPTATVGVPLAVDINFWYNGSLSAFQIIQVTTTAILNVSYYA